MVDYDPHITGLCIIPWKTGNNQGTLFSLQKSTHSHPGMDLFFIKNLGQDQQNKHWSLNRPVFFEDKNKGKNYPTRFFGVPIFVCISSSSFPLHHILFRRCHLFSANFAPTAKWCVLQAKWGFSQIFREQKKRRDSIDLFPKFPIFPKSQLRGFGVDSLAKPPFHSFQVQVTYWILSVSMLPTSVRKHLKPSPVQSVW